jgi:site-specific recombinase XerD
VPSPANKGQTYVAEPLTRAEFDALRDAITGRGPLAIRNRALLTVMYCSGVRVAEALALKSTDLDDDLTTVRVRRGKGDKLRMVAFDGSTGDRALVREWLTYRRDKLGLNGKTPVFCSVSSGVGRKPGAAMDTSYARRLLPKLGKAAGIEKRVHPHGLRHSHAAELVGRRVPLHAITGQLGHRSVVTTNVYLEKLTATDLVATIASTRTDEAR